MPISDLLTNIYSLDFLAQCKIVEQIVYDLELTPISTDDHVHLLWFFLRRLILLKAKPVFVIKNALQRKMKKEQRRQSRSHKNKKIFFSWAFDFFSFF